MFFWRHFSFLLPKMRFFAVILKTTGIKFQASAIYLRMYWGQCSGSVVLVVLLSWTGALIDLNPGLFLAKSEPDRKMASRVELSFNINALYTTYTANYSVITAIHSFSRAFASHGRFSCTCVAAVRTLGVGLGFLSFSCDILSYIAACISFFQFFYQHDRRLHISVQNHPLCCGRTLE